MAQLYFKYGAMGSSKTANALMARFNYEERGQETLLVKPRLDTRDGDHMVYSRIGLKHPCIYFDEMRAMADSTLQSYACIIIDEAQFLDESLVDVCNQLANRGVRVIIAGLDMDFQGVPFGPIPALCAVADEVTKVHAICVKCGALAYVSHRLVKNDRRVMLGEAQEYEPLCRACYQQAVKEEGQDNQEE